MGKSWLMLPAILTLGFNGPAEAADCADDLDTTNVSVGAIIDCLKFLRVSLEETQSRLTIARKQNLAMTDDLNRLASFRQTTPRGAVVAFDLPGCPEGWVPMREVDGRMIVGATERGDPSFEWRQMGGEERVELGSAQMPAHRHITTPPVFARETHPWWAPWAHTDLAASEYGFDTREKSFRFESINDDSARYPYTSIAGGKGDGTTEPHNNMPPYIALYFCKKD